MDRHFMVAVNRDWIIGGWRSDKRHEPDLVPLGSTLDGPKPGAKIYLRFRRADGQIHVEETSVVEIRGAYALRSRELCRTIAVTSVLTILLFFEGTSSMVRCVVDVASGDLWEAMATLDPPIRLVAYDLPPVSVTHVEAEDVYTAAYELIAGGDRELFSAKTHAFLAAPHILVPLFAHVLSLSSKDNIDFPLVLRTTAEQIRALLTDTKYGDPKIRRIVRNHAELWSEVLGERIAFVDGGLARIAGVPSAEPLAIRVGIYSVIPGETNLGRREDWFLAPYVMGDVVRRVGGVDDSPDPKRLQEASRYVLEPLTALKYLETHSDVSSLFLHGPLVNQFTQYDEGEPSYLPCLEPAFLADFGITEASVTRSLSGIPSTPLKVPLWNQFMAVYGALQKAVFDSPIPMSGVVERSVGRWLSHAVIDQIVDERRTTEAHGKRLMDIIERFQISDDFLFGCVLDEGEYIEPIVVNKNAPRRARHHWQEVVKQYPRPHATVMKTSATNFPYRVELNTAALAKAGSILRLLYHTSRLLPQYAFPVGLDIVDKYAKVPDWLSRGVSARITADVLRRALNTGDPKIVAQVRQFLARTPRDFFFRPQA